MASANALGQFDRDFALTDRILLLSFLTKASMSRTVKWFMDDHIGRFERIRFRRLQLAQSTGMAHRDAPFVDFANDGVGQE
ncbi:MAG: hypothetical protein MZU79_06800 [Anaerotruncus sp.]|nr:hypothetical protein [Anaerotruncus sp.]